MLSTSKQPFLLSQEETCHLKLNRLSSEQKNKTLHTQSMCMIVSLLQHCDLKLLCLDFDDS